MRAQINWWAPYTAGSSAGFAAACRAHNTTVLRHTTSTAPLSDSLSGSPPVLWQREAPSHCCCAVDCRVGQAAPVLTNFDVGLVHAHWTHSEQQAEEASLVQRAARLQRFHHPHAALQVAACGLFWPPCSQPAAPAACVYLSFALCDPPAVKAPAH